MICLMDLDGDAPEGRIIRLWRIFSMALLAGSREGSGVFNRIALARWAFPRRSAAISLIIKKNKSRNNSGEGENPYYERKTICEP